MDIHIFKSHSSLYSSVSTVALSLPYSGGPLKTPTLPFSSFTHDAGVARYPPESYYIVSECYHLPSFTGTGGDIANTMMSTTSATTATTIAGSKNTCPSARSLEESAHDAHAILLGPLFENRAVPHRAWNDEDDTVSEVPKLAGAAKDAADGAAGEAMETAARVGTRWNARRRWGEGVGGRLRLVGG